RIVPNDSAFKKRICYREQIPTAMKKVKSPLFELAPSLIRIVERLRFCTPGAFFRSSRLMLYEQKIGPSDRALPPRRHLSIPRRWFHCRRASDLRSAEP